MNRTRLGACALAAAAVLFVLYPAVRPWQDEATLAGATASMSSTAWVAAHFFAMVGFILVPPGLLALWAVLARTRAEPLALAAAIVAWIGAGLTLPYFGAEGFGLHAAAIENPAGLLDLVDAVRYQPLALTTFGLGLLAQGVGAILAAVAVWRSGRLPRASGIPFAIGFTLFLPQFFLPAAGRIGHGILTGVGLAWLAVALWRGGGGDSRS